MQSSAAQLTGSSPAWRAFRTALEGVAASNATVLLWGQPGTGKSLAAEALHQLSPRRAGPLVAVSLAAVPESLLEAELFGHEAGAFTDARRERPGRFRRAQGGTLVLEEIDLLPRALQGKLLRVLQERAVEPLGASAPVPVDVRVVATAGSDLAARVEAGSFRADLYWRLAVVALELPPLRVRTGDLPELAQVLLPRLAERSGCAPREIGAAALARLAEHSWPGNVRELENALERVLVLAPGAPGAGGARSGANAPAPAIEPAEFDFLFEPRAGAAEELARALLARGLKLPEFELALLRVALREQRGNLSGAARAVGLTRRALEYRLANAEASGAGAAELAAEAEEAP